MNGAVFYGIAGVLLLISLVKDKNKTKMDLLKAWSSFRMLLPHVYHHVNCRYLPSAP